MIKQIRQHLTETGNRITQAAGSLPDTDEPWATEQYTPEQAAILRDKLAQAEKLVDEVRAALFQFEK